jgi:hypothetical protein
MDVAFKVERVQFTQHKTYLMGQWLNMGFVHTFGLGVRQAIGISEPRDWQICLQPKAKCIRYAKWVAL